MQGSKQLHKVKVHVLSRCCKSNRNWGRRWALIKRARVSLFKHCMMTLRLSTLERLSLTNISRTALSYISINLEILKNLGGFNRPGTIKISRKDPLNNFRKSITDDSSTVRAHLKRPVPANISNKSSKGGANMSICCRLFRYIHGTVWYKASCQIFESIRSASVLSLSSC